MQGGRLSTSCGTSVLCPHCWSVSATGRPGGIPWVSSSRSARTHPGPDVSDCHRRGLGSTAGTQQPLGSTGGLSVAVTPVFLSREGKGPGRIRLPPSEPGSGGSLAGRHGFKYSAFYQKGKVTVQVPSRFCWRTRSRSSDDLGNEFPGDIGQTHVPAVVIVGKPLMVYP
jgi:hypothetical protein